MIHSRQIRRLAVGVLFAAFAPLACADLVVVVGHAATTDTLSADQVAKIFMGKSKAFPDGSTAVPIEQSEGSAARDAFHRKVTGKDAAQLKAYWSRLIFSGKGQPPKDVGDDTAVKAAVASTPGAIGYLDAALVDGSIKVVLRP